MNKPACLESCAGPNKTYSSTNVSTGRPKSKTSKGPKSPNTKKNTKSKSARIKGGKKKKNNKPKKKDKAPDKRKLDEIFEPDMGMDLDIFAAKNLF